VKHHISPSLLQQYSITLELLVDLCYAVQLHTFGLDDSVSQLKNALNAVLIQRHGGRYPWHEGFVEVLVVELEDSAQALIAAQRAEEGPESGTD